MRRRFGSWLIATTALAAACGGDAFTAGDGGGGSGATASSSSSSGSQGGDGGSGASSSSSSSTSGSGGGCGNQSGECQTNEHCQEGDCVELTPCGFRVCETIVEEAVACSNDGQDQCCNSGECAEGSCHLGPWAANCGGMQEQQYNICAEDQCQEDGDCPAPPPSMLTVCAPANTMGYPMRHCLLGSCRTNDDCNAEPGGLCATITPTCCSGANILLCTYPSDGCRSDGDCPGGYCAQDGERARCHDGFYPCPA